MANAESGRAELERCVEPDYVGLSVELPPFAGVSLHRGKGNVKLLGRMSHFLFGTALPALMAEN